MGYRFEHEECFHRTRHEYQIAQLEINIATVTSDVECVIFLCFSLSRVLNPDTFKSFYQHKRLFPVNEKLIFWARKHERNSLKAFTDVFRFLQMRENNNKHCAIFTFLSLLHFFHFLRAGFSWEEKSKEYRTAGQKGKFQCRATWKALRKFFEKGKNRFSLDSFQWRHRVQLLLGSLDANVK